MRSACVSSTPCPSTHAGEERFCSRHFSAGVRDGPEASPHLPVESQSPIPQLTFLRQFSPLHSDSGIHCRIWSHVAWWLRVEVLDGWWESARTACCLALFFHGARDQGPEPLTASRGTFLEAHLVLFFCSQTLREPSAPLYLFGYNDTEKTSLTQVCRSVRCRHHKLTCPKLHISLSSRTFLYTHILCVG